MGEFFSFFYIISEKFRNFADDKTIWINNEKDSSNGYSRHNGYNECECPKRRRRMECDAKGWLESGHMGWRS